MKISLRHGTMVFAVLAGIVPAVAQIGSKPPDVQMDIRGNEKLDPAQLRLTEVQKNAIAEAVRRERKAVIAPPRFVVVSRCSGATSDRALYACPIACWRRCQPPSR